MGLPIFYTDGEHIDLVAGNVVLKGGEGKHAVKSLRVRKGDRILIGDGCGNSYETVVGSIDDYELKGEIVSKDFSEKEKPSVYVYQGISRPKSMEEAIIRSAETGVERLTPFLSGRSPRGSLEKVNTRKDRWLKIAVESSKLSRRRWRLEIGEPIEKLKESGVLKGHKLNIVLWEDEKSSAFSCVLPEKRPESIGLVAGPEGGFSESEVDSLLSEGAVTAGMGDLIMRTESAAAYAVMLIRYKYGNLLSGGTRRC